MLQIQYESDDDMTPAEEQRIKAATSWLYRTRIKDPRDSVAEIVAETGVPRDEVEAWIAEADRLLGLVD